MVAGELEDAIANHAEDMLLRALDWMHGSWSFEPDTEVAPPEDLNLRPTTAAVMRRVMQKLSDHGVDCHLGDRGRVLQRNGASKTAVLSAEESFLLSQLDRTATLREVLERMPGDPTQAERCLLELLCLGVVEPIGPRVKADRGEPPVKDEVDRPTTSDSVVRSPSEAASRHVAPQTPDPFETALRVDDAIRQARSCVGVARVWDAIQLLEKVLPLAAGRQRARGRILLAQCYLENPHWTRLAAEQLRTAIEESPENADAWCWLGIAYDKAGLTRRAEASLRRALALDAGHRRAIDELRGRVPAPRPRLVSKLLAQA